MSDSITIVSPKYTLLPFEKKKVYRSIAYGALAVFAFYLAARLEDVELVHFFLNNIDSFLISKGITIEMDWKPLIAGFTPVLVDFLRKWAVANEYQIITKE